MHSYCIRFTIVCCNAGVQLYGVLRFLRYAYSRVWTGVPVGTYPGTGTCIWVFSYFSACRPDLHWARDTTRDGARDPHLAGTYLQE